MASSPERSRERRRSGRDEASDEGVRGKYSRRTHRSRSRSSEADGDERKRSSHGRRRGYDDDDDERSHRRRRHHRRDRSTSDREDDWKHSRRHKERSYRDRSPSRDPSRRHQRSRSPYGRKRKSPEPSRSPPRKSRAPLPSQNESYQAEIGPGDGQPPPEKQKPNFKPTGLLAKEANTVAGTSTVLKYHEPPESRKPPPREAWRLYVFKGKDMVDTINLYHRSAWLVGRDQKVTDYLIDHPSVSKQHAVIQFRHRTSKNEFGDVTSKVKPYLIDLESANGTHMNGKKVEASRYVELVDQDVVKFGDSEREYVVMLPPAEK